MGQGLGHQLEQAFARNDWTKALVQKATGGNFLGQVRLVLEGNAEIRVLEKPPTVVLPDLTTTAPTFGDWLTAREKLHLFLTGETVNLREMFIIPDEILSRTDIMPIFRPAGATYRMAMDWKVKLGMASYEEVDVMNYIEANGSQVPELYYINRSIEPDTNTLGDHAKSPDDLIKMSNTIWTNLYGWSDADNLHYLITGNHLDSGKAWTWFPNDRLPGDEGVASGYWSLSFARAWFYWCYRYCRFQDVGARVATSLPLRVS